MGMPTKQRTRAERMKDHAAVIDRARRLLAVTGLLVRGREARARDGATPLEVEFARTKVDGRGLPAAVWVALRQDDLDAAIEVMTEVSEAHFVIEEREVIGEGYRLQSVQDTLPLPETEVLTAQLGAALDIPVDVLSMLADWGAADPRAVSEIDELLSSRFGPAECPDVPPKVVAALPPPAPAPAAQPTGGLTLTVADAEQVLRLDDVQVRALATLVRNATVTITLQ